jgi:hypothetical protein
MQRQVASGLADRPRAHGQVKVASRSFSHLVDGVVVGAMEIAAQQAVARVALVLHDPDHAPHRHAHQRQRVAGQHQRTLDGFGHDLGGAGGLQALQVVVVARAHDHRHLGRMGARMASTLSALGRVT